MQHVQRPLVFGFVLVIGITWALAVPFASAAEPRAKPQMVPKGTRTLGISVNAAEDNNYDTAFQIAKSVGMEAVSLSVNWDQVETAPGVYGMTPNFLAIANTYYSATHTKIDLVLRPIDTNGKHVPRDLQNTAFDDPVMIARFQRVVDYVFSQLPHVQLNFLSIGNEIDLGIGGDAMLWRQYEVFYRTVKAYVHAVKPGLRVGTTATLYGLSQSARAQLARINRVSDIVIVTYYPLHEDFSVKDPAVMRGEIESLLALYPRKPVYFVEIGYPASPLLGSSQAQQRTFIDEVFQIWDAHSKRIPYLSFTWLTDISSAQVDELVKYYGLDDERFKAYLLSLGLRTHSHSGKDKPAFKALRRATQKRGW